MADKPSMQGTHEGKASTDVRVNAPPSGGSLSVVAPVSAPREFVHRFTVSAPGWVDADGGLTYAFFYRIRNGRGPWSIHTTTTTTYCIGYWYTKLTGPIIYSHHHHHVLHSVLVHKTYRAHSLFTRTRIRSIRGLARGEYAFFIGCER